MAARYNYFVMPYVLIYICLSNINIKTTPVQCNSIGHTNVGVISGCGLAVEYIIEAKQNTCIWF